MTAQEIRALAPVGIIFTGGADSVYKPGALCCAPEILELGIPALGICYGMQPLCHTLGGGVTSCEKSEYGVVEAAFSLESELLCSIEGTQNVLMSHTDRVVEYTPGSAPLRTLPCARSRPLKIAPGASMVCSFIWKWIIPGTTWTC